MRKEGVEPRYHDIMDDLERYAEETEIQKPCIIFRNTFSLLLDIIYFTKSGAFEGSTPLSNISTQTWDCLGAYALGYLDHAVQVASDDMVLPSEAVKAFRESYYFEVSDVEWLPAYNLILEYVEAIESSIVRLIDDPDPNERKFYNLLREKIRQAV